jgi:SAM-dependent methyltransferase
MIYWIKLKQAEKRMNNPGQEWHKRYSVEEYVYGKEANKFVQESIEYLVPGDTLLVAEGEGRNAVFYAQHGHNATAWDIAPSGIEKCKRLAAENNVKVTAEVQDILTVDWPENRWDNVVGIFCHFHESDRENLCNNIRKTVRPGGRVLFEVYSKEQLTYASGGPKVPELLYTPQEWLDRFSDWKIIHFYYGERHRMEGVLHRGLAHVIQIIAVKPE